VLDGLALATLSFWSAAARLLIAVLGPPGGVGLEGLPLAAPTPGEVTGDEARGEDCFLSDSCDLVPKDTNWIRGGKQLVGRADTATTIEEGEEAFLPL
jgi:hypothetical protein